MKKEYNELTKRLLAEGYTVDNYPENVEVGSCGFGGRDRLNNFYGGFVYKRKYIWDQVFETPCGLQCKGSTAMTGMGYMGIEWEFENDMATVHCPYRKKDCQLKHEFLRGTGNLHHDLTCNVHRVHKEYQYEGSIEDLREQRDKRIAEERVAFIQQKKGRACAHHMKYDYDRERWVMHYDPEVCALNRCRGYCPILGRNLDKKRGNVFYDVRIEGRDYSKDGTLFEGERFMKLIKGERFFDRPASMGICRIFARQCQESLRQGVQGKAKYSEMLFMARVHNFDWRMEVFNIRAEERETRDLMQDLEDIQNGIQIVHASDQEKAAKERKKEKKDERRQKKIEKMEQKIIELGFGNLEEIDKRRAEKLLDDDRLEELEGIRRKKQKEEREQPVQMSLFDFM